MFPKKCILFIITTILVITKIIDSVEISSLADLDNIRIVCYYASSSAFKPGIGKFTPENINPHLCSHLIYAFGNITNDITFGPTNETIDIEQGGYAKFTNLKSYNKDLKTMLALGGWNERFVKFASIAANATKRSVFITNSIEFLRKYNFDGLDLDWQFPFLKDRRHFASLIQELREGYENESRATGQARLLLTITLPTLKDHITRGYDVPKLTKYVDWMNVLSYNYHTELQPLVNHHAQLYGVDDNSDYELNANYTINSYLESGAERQKLVLGIPTYGRAFTLANSTMTDIGSQAIGPGLKGDQTNESGLLAYYEICKKIKDDGWIVKRSYPNAMGPYAYKGNQWVCYDDEYVMRKKSQFVAENKLGGIMFWLIEYDDFRGYCSGKPFPLIEAAKEALITASGYIIENVSIGPNNSRRRPTTIVLMHQHSRGMGKATATLTKIQYTTPKPPPTPSYEMISPIGKIVNLVSTSLDTPFVQNDDEINTVQDIENDEEENVDGMDEVRVVCYYASWSADRSGIGKFTPEDIDPQLCTHIIYAFGVITEEITFKPLSDRRDIELGGYEKFTGLKAYNKDLKTMISLGGWNEGTVKFAAIAANATKRSIFIKNAIDYLRQYNFDGFDLDWQFPLRKDRDSYSSLIQELREGFENESKQTGRSRLLLTITLHPLKDHITGGYDVPHLTKNVDWMNVLTYDFHTAQEPFVGHHAKLYSEDGSLDDELNSNYTINSYLDAGAERSKLVLGIPTYGRSYNLTDPNITDLGSSADGPGLPGDQTGEAGFLAYYEICRNIKDKAWIVKRPYPDSMGPYAYKGDQWVGYGDKYSIRKKAEYVVENKLGGVMFWVIEYDDFQGNCSGKPFPLIRSAREILMDASTKVTPNGDQKTENNSTVMLPKGIQPSVHKQGDENEVEVPENDDGKNLIKDTNEVRVICYYSSWAAARSGIAKLIPEDIDPQLCTHIIYTFVDITKEITFKPLSEAIDIQQGGYAKFTGLKTYNKDLKTMLSLGILDEGTVNFAAIAANETKRRIFVFNAITYLRQYNFDGFDLDWQFPFQKDKRHYSLLIQELREGFENESRETGRPRLLLSITLPAATDQIYKGYNIPSLTKNVNWMNVMTYDYHTHNAPVVDHHTKLYGVDENSDYNRNVNYTIKIYLESGAEHSKLVLGIPTYGRSFKLMDPKRTNLGSSADGPGLQGNQTSETGLLAYYEICTKIKYEGWTVERPYPTSMGPYAYKGNQWVCYDDEYSIKRKAEYVVKNKLGGIMFWPIEYDDFLGNCGRKKFPLIEAAKETLMAASRNITPNIIPINEKDWYLLKPIIPALAKPSEGDFKSPRGINISTLPIIIQSTKPQSIFSSNITPAITNTNEGRNIDTSGVISNNDKTNYEDAELRNIIEDYGGIENLRKILKIPKLTNLNSNICGKTNQGKPCIEAVPKGNKKSKPLVTTASEKSERVNIVFNIHL